jgi:hypothetical protein
MAVTVETYTATATWTAAQLAALFEDAFIDAGLMTAWYDSFLNTVENRILEIEYDDTKTYGKTYYWFQFTTGGVFLHVATGWNATTHVPTGTQYLDYFATTTNATTNHKTLRTLTPSTTVTLTRYTSDVNADFSWFLIRNGTSSYNFHIPDADAAKVSWLDLNKVLFCPFLTANTSISAAQGYVSFTNNGAQLRRSYLGSAALRGNVTAGEYHNTRFELSTFVYQGSGNVNNSITNNIAASSTSILVPTAFNNTNPLFTTDVVPVFTSVNYWSYLNEAMPLDFGISFHYANNTMVVRDKLIVTAASEEWEMIAVSNASFTGGTYASPMFVARVV